MTKSLKLIVGTFIFTIMLFLNYTTLSLAQGRFGKEAGVATTPCTREVHCAGDNDTAKSPGDYGVAAVGNGTQAVALAGRWGVAVTGENGTATAGEYGVAFVGKNGKAIGGAGVITYAYDGGNVVTGDGGIAAVLRDGSASAGNFAVAVAGERSTAIALDSSIARVTADGHVTVGKYSVALAGHNSTAQAGVGSVIIFKFQDPKNANKSIVVVGVIGKNHLKPDTKYKLDEKHHKIIPA